MSDPIIAQRRPYVQAAVPGAYFWCSCGQSKAQPFCDGSHKGTSFAPVKVDITEPKTVAWCGCKHSGKGAMCDGTHSRL